MLSEEFNGGFAGAGLYHKDSMYLGGMEGTVVFHPNIKYTKKIEPYKLLIDYVKLDDSLMTGVANFTAPPNFKQVQIKADYPFILNENLHIDYRVLGTNDTSWQLLKSDGIIDIKNLRDGSYIVEIKFNDGATTLKSIPFTVTPYWYNTWWAKVLFGLFFLAGIYIVFKWRYTSLKNKNMELVKHSQDKLFATIAHDLKSPMNNFVNLSDNIRFLIEQNDFETIAAIGNEMDEKGRNINLLVSNILNWSLLQQGLLNPIKEKILLQDILDEILPAYKDIARYKNINIVSNRQPKFSVVTDSNILSTILRNLIDNAIKFSSSNSIINIDCVQENNTTTINIANKNETVNNRTLNEIKAIFDNKTTAQPYNNNLGLGIAIMQQNVALLDGQLSIETNDNSVTFSLQL